MSEASVVPPIPADSAPTETFANYLAKQFVSKMGFVIGTVPEAERLAAVSDIILTLHDGFPFTIVCLIDREVHPGKRFGLSIDELEAIARDCMKYSRSLRGGRFGKMPVAIRIAEIGPTDAEQFNRLQYIKRPSLFSKALMAAFVVNVDDATVWSSTRMDKPERPFIEKMLQAPRQSDSELTPFASVEPAARTTPYLTIGLAAALIAVFAATVVFGVEPATRTLEPTLKTLIAYGALQYPLVVDQGQWYRMFAAPLLHGNFSHIALNVVALLLAGSMLESTVGRLWFSALFVIGGLGGACGSLLLTSHNLVAVGASGAIMGLFAALFVVSLRFTGKVLRTRMQVRALQVLVPSLLPLASNLGSAKIDYGAHTGGAIAGALAALALIQLWPKTEVLPSWRKLAIGAIALGAVGVVSAAAAVPGNYRLWSEIAHLIPQDQVPKTNAQITESLAASLLEKYPNDPRAHLYEAVILLKKDQLAEGEQELRKALADEDFNRKAFTPAFNLTLHASLALVLQEEHRPDEAKAVARPACAQPALQSYPKLNEKGLCAETSR
jgi:rhomboid protease GluP